LSSIISSGVWSGVWCRPQRQRESRAGFPLAQRPAINVHPERRITLPADGPAALISILRGYAEACVCVLSTATRATAHATPLCRETVPASGQTDRGRTYRRELTSPDMTDRAWPVGTGRCPGSFTRFKTTSDATTCWQQDTEGIQDTSSGQKVFEILGNKLQPHNTV
jgi:hypothetical protein